jgi:predicted O-linked N-acetylglucosamine transferase (SPINDLY family)
MSGEPASGTLEAVFDQAVALHRAGRHAEAEGLYRQVLRVAPRHPGALHLLGVLHYHLGRHGVAIELMEQALAVNPALPEAWSNRGLALADLRRYDEAMESFDRALALRGDYPDAHSNRGNALSAMRRYEEALACYERALTLRGDFAEAWSNRGLCLHVLGRDAEALASCERALALRPTFAEAFNNRGLALYSLGRYPEALASYDRALALRPAFAEALRNGAYSLELLMRPDEAAENLRRAIELDPGNPEAPARLLHLRQRLCAWDGLERDIDRLRRRVTEDRSGHITPFSFLALPGTTPAEQRQCAEQFAAERFGRELAQAPLLPPGPPRAREGRLRIGYLSADFREHALSYLLAEVIELHDRGAFEVLGYSTSAPDASAMRRRLQAAFDGFRDIAPLTDAAAARLILEDGADILVDLTGYTLNSRAGISALRPAPVQAIWLGYPGTMGNPRMADYVIGDPIVTPPTHAAHFTEKLALLPHCFQPNDRRRAVGATPTRAVAGLPVEGFVFCCFNQSYKIAAATFDRWCRILGAVHGSFLWLLAESPSVMRNLREEAGRRGIAPERLVFAPRIGYAEHLARLPLADLFLDTLPFNAGATASDFLWMGVPLLTCIGETLAGRYAASLLHAAGLAELVTRTPQDYEALAIDLATHRDRLAALKAKLEAARPTCALFDAPRFTRDLERLYQRMWRDVSAGEAQQIVLDSAD